MCRKPLRERKKPLRETSMNEAAYVDRAAGWSQQLSQTEARGPGDLENAWRRLETRYGIPWRLFWTLKYRRPPSITAGLYHLMRAVYRAECARHMRKLGDDLETTKRIAGPDDPAVAAAEAALGKSESEE